MGQERERWGVVFSTGRCDSVALRGRLGISLQVEETHFPGYLASNPALCGEHLKKTTFRRARRAAERNEE